MMKILIMIVIKIIRTTGENNNEYTVCYCLEPMQALKQMEQTVTLQ